MVEPRGLLLAALRRSRQSRSAIGRKRRAAIRNLKASSTLALDNDVAVPRAQFDLPSLLAPVNLLGNQGRARPASPDLTLRNITASMNAERCCCGIEVRLKHDSELVGWYQARDCESHSHPDETCSLGSFDEPRKLIAPSGFRFEMRGSNSLASSTFPSAKYKMARSCRAII